MSPKVATVFVRDLETQQATDPEERYLVYLEDSYLLERLEVWTVFFGCTRTLASLAVFFPSTRARLG